MKIKLITISIAFLFILIFLYTGITKVVDYNEFVSEIKESPLLKGMPVFLVWVIPSLEIILAFMMLARRWRLIALYSSCILMVLFTIYLIALSQFVEYIPCSCGGFIGSLPRNVHIGLNCTLVLLGALGIALEKKQTRSV